MDRLLSKFEKSIGDIGGFDVSDKCKIIVAYSGGADSSLLLHLTVRYFVPRGVTVEAAHLNHMIRGDEAFRDEEFCKESCKQLGICCNVRRADIPALCVDGGSVEEVARRERYAFFAGLIEENEKRGVKTYVFTAHNADDNLETVLFNLVRGTALKGICGIPNIREGRYVRPILFMTGDEIRTACNSFAVPYVTDSTNLESDYTRNYIRHNIVPHLEKLCPTPQASVMRMCSSLKTDEDFIDREVDRFLSACGTMVPVSEFVELHTAVKSRVLIKLYDEYAASVGASSHLEKVHVDAILERTDNGTDTFSISVPSGISFICDDGGLRFKKRDKSSNTKPLHEPVSLEINTPAEFFCGEIILADDINKLAMKNQENIYNLFIHKGIKFDKIKGKLKIRTRENGDVFRFGGMTHKVKRLFCDRKIPVCERDILPIVCDDDGIVWIPGFSVRDDVKATDGESVYHLVYRKRD